MAMLLVLAACGTKEPASASARALPPIARPHVPAPGDPDCPRTGTWQPCGLMDRIVRAGLSFKATGDSVRVPFLPVPGVRYRVAMTDTLLAFFFRDSTAAQKAIAPLDTVQVRPPADTAFHWPRRPTLIQSANLVAIYFASTPRQIERIRLAITAGPPAVAPAAH
jgi:hypothetical protein